MFSQHQQGPLPAPSHTLTLLHLPRAEFSLLRPFPFNSSLQNQSRTSKFFSFCYPEQSGFPLPQDIQKQRALEGGWAELESGKRKIPCCLLLILIAASSFKMTCFAPAAACLGFSATPALCYPLWVHMVLSPPIDHGHLSLQSPA